MSTRFQAALKKLIGDEGYREQVKNDPRRMPNDFQFTDAELGMLMALGQTGNDGSVATGAKMAPGGGCSSAGGVPSDRRLKTGIEQVAALPSGIRLYRFRYRRSETEYVGVLAQEIAEMAPHAVSKGRDGFLRVDYQALGLTMLPYAAWKARVGSHCTSGTAA